MPEDVLREIKELQTREELDADAQAEALRRLIEASEAEETASLEQKVDEPAAVSEAETEEIPAPEPETAAETETEGKEPEEAPGQDMEPSASDPEQEIVFGSETEELEASDEPGPDTEQEAEEAEAETAVIYEPIDKEASMPEPAPEETPESAAPAAAPVTATAMRSKKYRTRQPEKTEAEEPAEENPKEKPKDKKKSRKDKPPMSPGKAFLIGLLLFAVLTALLVTVWAKADTAMFHGTTEAPPAEDVNGDGEPDNPEAVVPQEPEKLSASMKPIAIDEASPFYEAFTKGDRVNILMMGVNQGMTDTMMLGSYDMENQTLDIISVPRDTFYYRSSYANASYGFQKINAVYRTEGVAATAEAVSSLLYGMPIHYYIIVEYNDIRKIIDTIGGVEIYVPFYMKYRDTTKGQELYIDIPAGNQIIDSSNVIEFLRFRHTNPSFAEQGYRSYQRGDLDRILVQQDFVKAFIKKCLQLGNITNVAKVTLENVESDLTYSMATKIASKAMEGFDMENISTYMLPGIDKTLHELSFWVQNEEETYSMLENIYHLKKEEPADETGETAEGEQAPSEE